MFQDRLVCGVGEVGWVGEEEVVVEEEGEGEGEGGTEAGFEAKGEEAEGCVEAGWVDVSEAKRSVR